MAAYLTEDGYRERFGEEELLALADKDGDGVVDAPVWDAAVADAEAELDSYLGARYALPLATVPRSVRAAAYKLVRYMLNPFATEDGPERRGYTEAVDWLKRVSRGEVALGLPEDQESDAEEETAVVVSSREPVFTSDTWDRRR